MTTPTGILFYDPQAKPLSTLGQFQAGCSYVFYLTGTTSPTNVYSDGALTTSIGNVVNADGNGRFIPIYLNPATTYRVQLWSGNNGTGTKLEDVDPVNFFIATGYAVTAAELAASVVPTNLQYAPDPIADPRRYGAKLDGSTDDTVAFQNATAVLAINGGILQFSGTPLFNSANITISKNVTWRGPQGNPGIDNPVASGTYLQSGTIILNPSYTLNLANKASLKNCTVLCKTFSAGGAFPLPFTGSSNATSGVAAFSGTAITATGDDACIDSVLVLGFAQAFSSTGFERTRILRMYGDNTAGILITTSTDIARIEDCHFWPFLTAHQSWTTGALSSRSGSAYKITLHYDTGMFINCFSYAYAVGFDIQSNNEVNLINCFADGGSTGSGQIGMKFSGSAELIEVIGGGSSGVDQGAYVNVTPAAAIGAISFNGAQFWGNLAHIVSDSHRILSIRNCFLRDTNGAPRVGITINSGVGSNLTNIINNTFDSVSTAYSINAAASATCTIGPNTYNTNVTNGVAQNFVYDSNSSVINHSRYSSNANAVIIAGQTARGTAALPTASQQNDSLLSLQGLAYDSAVFGSTASIRFTLRATATAGSTPGGIIFSTSASGASTFTDRVLINENGNLVPVADNTYSCGATGLRWSAVWAANGSIQTSDSRAKSDVAPSALGLDFVNALRAVKYRFTIGGNKVAGTNEDGSPKLEAVPGARTHYGLIAQEVKAALDKTGAGDFAGWVLTDKNNPDSEQGLRYEQFIPVLIKAVQELSAEVAALKAKG